MSHPDRPMLNGVHTIDYLSYGEVVDALQRNKDFFHSPEAVEQTIEYGQFVGRAIVSSLDSAVLVCGDGFPYYVARLDNPPIPVPEIGRFNTQIYDHYRGQLMNGTVYRAHVTDIVTIDQIRDHWSSTAGMKDPYGEEKAALLDQHTGTNQREGAASLSAFRDDLSFALEDDIWPCTYCIEVNRLPNLRDSCVECDQTSFKPRDIFRAFHDVDMQVIVDDDPMAVASHIRNAVHSIGVPTNDEYLGYAIQNAGSVFPVDITVINKTDFLRQLSVLREEPDWKEVRVPAVKLWYSNEPRQWTLGVDFVFSMDPLVVRREGDREVLTAFQHVRRDFIHTHDIDSVMDEVAQLGRAHGRLMQSPLVSEGVRRHLTETESRFLIEM